LKAATVTEATGAPPGSLYVVATPIGNLEDMTCRAVRVLREVDLIAAEDTRHSRKLLRHYGIDTPLTSCFAHNELRKAEGILDRLRSGRSVALISDAGTPAISDPGYLLVRLCREAGLPVTPVPGASAVVAALSVAGQPVDRFAFEGFLPSKAAARRSRLASLSREERTLVFYEAPHRLGVCLRDLEEACGAERGLTVARELTKLHEEVFCGSVGEARRHFEAGRVRGELVLLLAPAPPARPRETVREALLRWQRQSDLPPRQIVKEVARELGLPGSEVYRESLRLKKGEKE
jgi:16S rRNA (cytidine1402-2'-O)-methyltransferase